jgi:hypothetical protein
MSHKTIIATAATVVGISALTSTAVFAHGGGGHFGGGAYSVPHMSMTSMPRPAAFQSVGKVGAPPTTSTRIALPPRFLDKAPAAQQATAAPKNPIQKALDAAKQSAQRAAAAPKNPIQKALDAARQSAQQAAAAAPKNPIQKALDAAKQSAQNAQAQAKAQAQAQATLGHAVQTPAGTGGRVADQIPTVPVCCKPPPPHDPDNRPGGRPGWGFPVGGVVVVDPGVDGYPVSCLRKQYLPDGNVVFIDVCTNEVVKIPGAN